MNVYRSGVAEIIKSPNLIEELIAGKNVIVIRCEEIKQLQLLRRNIDRFSAKLQLIFLQADLNILKFDNLVIIGVGVILIAAKHGLYSGRKLFKIEGLIIVLLLNKISLRKVLHLLIL